MEVVRGVAVVFAFALALALASVAGAAPADDRTLVVFDNDFAGPGGPDIQPLPILLAAPRIRLLGCTVVTGDGWRDEETAHLLRFLEIAGVADRVPVAVGAEMPLIRTPATMALWERSYGTIPWKGAWNPARMGPAFHPDDPAKIVPWAAGLPTHRPVDADAAHFLIETVHAHPHRVVVLAAGPLTNLALAIRLDPGFAAEAKALVFMGGLLDSNLAQVTGNADFNSDFNLLFDPEAAHIVLTAPWADITAIGNVGNDVTLTPALLDRMKRAGTTVATYLATYAIPGLPLWDELAAAIVVDPSLVTRSVTARMDVDLDHNLDYGRAHVWPDALAPRLGERPVRIVQTVDQKRFVALFLRSLGAAAPDASR